MSDTKKKLGSLKPKSHGAKPDKLDTLQDEDTNNLDEHEQTNVDVEGVNNENDVNVEEHDEDNHNEDVETNDSEDVGTGVTLLGRVKWFNDRRGYGYITCIQPGEYTDQDIFVHHTNIRPQEKSYRTLHINEYVQFRLGDADLSYDDEHNLLPTEYDHQATSVTGVMNGPLLCDGPSRPNNRRGRDFRGGSNRDHSGPPRRDGDSFEYGRNNDDFNNDDEPRQRHQRDNRQVDNRQVDNRQVDNRQVDNRQGGYQTDNRQGGYQPRRRENNEWESVSNKGRGQRRVQ
jgi:CspA family cold shock protein